MLIDSHDAHLVSTLGWVDKEAVWHYDVASGRARQVMLGDAKYVSIRAGRADFFATVHHYNDHRLVISVHAIASPDTAQARLALSGDDCVFDGDIAMWDYVPCSYTQRQSGACYLVLVHPEQPTGRKAET